MGDCVLREEKKAEKRQELVGACLDCFVEKGLTVATTKDLCKAVSYTHLTLPTKRIV